MSKLKQELPAIVKTIRDLERSTTVEFSSVTQVRRAFTLGLWYKAFPEYMLENLNTLYSWDLKEIDPETANSYEGLDNGFKFQFISDTGDSWHQCYRDLRSLGWRRLKVHRKGGRLQYLFKIENTFDYMPEGFTELHLLLDISISTCKQVQVGTEMKEVPIMKTVCEDLVELPDDHFIKDINDGETVETIAVESRCDHGNLSGCCNQSDCPHFMGHEDTEPSVDHYDNMAEQGIIGKDNIPF